MYNYLNDTKQFLTLYKCENLFIIPFQFRSPPEHFQKEKDAYRQAPHEQDGEFYSKTTNNIQHAQGFNFPAKELTKDPPIVEQSFPEKQNPHEDNQSDLVFYDGDDQPFGQLFSPTPTLFEPNKNHSPDRHVFKELKENDQTLPVTQYQKERSFLKTDHRIPEGSKFPNFSDQNQQVQFFESLSKDGDNFQNHFSNFGQPPAFFEGNKFQSNLDGNNLQSESNPNHHSGLGLAVGINSFHPTQNPNNGSSYQQLHFGKAILPSNKLNDKKFKPAKLEEQKRPERSSLFQLSPDTVGYQHVNFNGVNFKFEIPKTEANSKKESSHYDFIYDEFPADSSKIEREVPPNVVLFPKFSSSIIYPF